MNGPRYRQEKKIFKLYNSKLQIDCIKSFGEFLYLYIIAYEDDNSLMRHSFLTEDPLNGLDDIIRHNTRFYLLINEKLTHYAKNYTAYMNKPKRIAIIIAYYAFSKEYGLFGYEADKCTAFKYYKLSAQLNSPFGTFKLAQCYEKGVGCKRNRSKALSFYRCSAKLGSIQGLHTFGTILLQNTFEYESSEESALFYLQLGASKASKCYPYVSYDYARYLEFKLPSNEITIGAEFCFRAYYRGAQNECPNCQYRIAQCFEYGELNVEIDVQKAFTYYKNAAFNGHVEAQVKIAQTLVDQGEQTEANYNLAFKYALKAATKENCIAMKYISIFYKNGLGVKKSLQISKWWERILNIQLKKQNAVLDLEIFSRVSHIVIEKEEITKVAVEDCEPISEYIKAV